MRSVYHLLCLLALTFAAHAEPLAQPPVQAAAQVPLQPQAPLVPGQLQAKPEGSLDGSPDGKPEGSPVDQPEPPRENIVDHIAKACPGLQPSVEKLREEISHPNQFCRFYLSQRRMRSPMADLHPELVMKGCVCLLREDGMGITSSPSSSTPSETFIPAAQTDSNAEVLGCNPYHEHVIRSEYREPKQFCRFYSTGLKRVSPIPGLSLEQITEGCKCILENKANTATRTSAWTRKSSEPATKVTQPASAKAPVGAVTTATIIVKTVIVSTG